MENKYKKLWQKIIAEKEPPRFARRLITMPFKEFKKGVQLDKSAFARKIVESYYAGDVYVFTDAFKPAFLKKLKERVFAYGQKTKQSSFKILDGSPNSHMVVDHGIGPKGGYVALDHSYYFFRWNKDQLGLFKDLNSVWQTIKVFGGFKKDEYLKNIPSDKVVDRIQIIHYPTGAGKITVHKDPYWNQRGVFGVEMTEKGKDYKTGGVYVMTDKKTRRYIDKQELGSIVSFFSSVNHGVEAVDHGEKVNWKSKKGRWYFTLNSVDSHHFKDRRGALPPNLKWKTN